jgi:hypothetical protein
VPVIATIVYILPVRWPMIGHDSVGIAPGRVIQGRQPPALVCVV